MQTHEILQADTWFYTGLTGEQYKSALERGVIEPVNLGDDVEQQSGIRYGLVISKEEAFIDGFIEGCLTLVYGEGQFSKVSVKIPQGTVLHHDVVDDEGSPISYVVTISIPVTDSEHVEDLTASPELAEEVIGEYEKEEEFGPRLPPVEPPFLD